MLVYPSYYKKKINNDINFFSCLEYNFFLFFRYENDEFIIRRAKTNSKK